MTVEMDFFNKILGIIISLISRGEISIFIADQYHEISFREFFKVPLSESTASSDIHLLCYMVAYEN